MEESGHGKSGKVPTGKKETTTSVGICGTGRVAGRRPGSKSPTPLVGYVIRRGVPAEAKTLQPERQELLGLLDDVLAGLDQVLGVLLVDLEDFLVAEVVDLGAGFVKGLLELARSGDGLPGGVHRFGLDGAAGGGNRGILLWSGVGRTGCDGELACLLQIEKSLLFRIKSVPLQQKTTSLLYYG